MKTLRNLLGFLALLALTLTHVSGARAYEFYMAGTDTIQVSPSDERIVVQFDTTEGYQHGGAAFFTAHQCLNSEIEAEYLPRGFRIYRLEEQCSYTASAEDLLSDSTINRVLPVYIVLEDSAEFRVTDVVAVQFNADVGLQTASALLDSMGLVFVDSSAYTHNLWRCALQDTIKSSPLAFGNAMHALSETRWACASFHIDGVLMSDPTDDYFQYQYYLKNTGQTGGVTGADIDVDSAWMVTLRDSTIKIAVIDEGITYHADLPVSRIEAGFDAAGENREIVEYDFDPTPGDTNAHGMACAGLIAASRNDTGIVGILPTCHIVPVKIFEDRYIGQRIAFPYDVGQAIRFAARSGAKVLSNSWGYYQYSEVPEVAEAIRDAVSPDPPWRYYGCIVIFSAGNSGDALKYERVKFPANMEEVIAVGATDKSDVRWEYSCRGPDLDVVAPSGNKGGSALTKGDVWTVDQSASKGWNPWITGSWGDTEDLDYTALFGGTSAAAPQVAGIAGLVLQRRRDFLTDADLQDTLNLVLRNIIDSSAVDLWIPGYDTLYGHGRVNAFRALLSVMRGDINNDRWVDALDLGELIDILNAGACAPFHPSLCDLNCDASIDALDLSYLIDHLFAGAPEPVICYKYYYASPPICE